MRNRYIHFIKRIYLSILLLPLISYLLAAPESACAQDLPVINGTKAVATVDGDPISVEDFKRALAASHAEALSGPQRKMNGPSVAGRIDYQDILHRMVNIRLILQEARNMGLDELPEITEALQTYSDQTLAELLLEEHVKTVRIDDDEIEPLYKDSVREWKIKSVLFKSEAAALQMKTDLEAGTDFDRLARQAVENGLAEAEEKGEYIKNQDLTRPMAALVDTMDLGAVSPIVTTANKQFIIFKLESVRYPQVIDEQAWGEAENKALKEKRIQANRDYIQQLKAKYAVVQQKLVGSLDYESTEPGFERLQKDRRVLVEIRGEEPITVADLTNALEQKFYHGVQQAIAGKRINAAKDQELEKMLQQRVLIKEARKKRIDGSEEYRFRVREHHRGLIFGMFIDKVIAPEITLELDELTRYYENNLSAFSSPKMVRINELVFISQNDALYAVNKLAEGTDFNWLAANAEGQVGRNAAGLLKFGGRLLTVGSLPPELQETLADVSSGNIRLYAAPRGYNYVLYVQQVRDPQPKPFGAVKNEIAKTVYNAKLKTALEDWAEKLKAYYPVKVYLTDIEQI